TISFGTLADGHVISNFPHAIGGQEACDQHIGAGPIELFVDDVIADRGYFEIPPLLVVENGGKHTGGIETRETEPIDRAVQPHQCSGTHVADDSVVFYRLIRHESSLLCCDVSSRRHSVAYLSPLVYGGARWARPPFVSAEVACPRLCLQDPVEIRNCR